MRDYRFEENVPGGKLGRWARPQATMTAAGEIQLTPQTWDMLERPDEVVVAFDRATQTIMIRRADKRERNRQAVIPKYRGRRVRARTLLEQFGIVIDQTIRFANPRFDEHNRLILELGTARPAYNGTRVGAFHKERKVPVERQLPVREKIAALAEQLKSSPPYEGGVDPDDRQGVGRRGGSLDSGVDEHTNRGTYSPVRGSGTRRLDGSRIRVEPPKPPAYHFEEAIGLTAIEERVEELLSERLAEIEKKIKESGVERHPSRRTRDGGEPQKRSGFHTFDY